jgi:hypothetical protein
VANKKTKLVRKKIPDPFYLRPFVPNGPVTRTRSISYQPGMRRTRSRYLHRDMFYPPAYDTGTYTVPGGEVQESPLLGKQITVSEGHPTRGLKASGPDLGGDFFTSKSYIKGLHGRSIDITLQHDYLPGHIGFDTRFMYYTGPVYPIDLRGPSGIPANLFPPAINSSNGELEAVGATAVARCKPTTSVANTYAALGDLLQDGIPHLPFLHTLKDRTQILKKSGGEFLNVEFGWIPLMSDFQSFLKAITHAHSVIQQFLRDNGRIIRRKYTFPPVRTVENLDAWRVDPLLSYTYPTWCTGDFSDVFGASSMVPGDVRFVRETTREQWFSGAFTYYLPIGSDTLSKMTRFVQSANKLSGALPTPYQIWELAPWSWAIDWFSNMGDVLSNISDHLEYGLVLRYGYIMEKTTMSYTYSCDRSIVLEDGQEITIPPITFVTETKVRRKANPFGFGFSWEGLSPIQLAIAGALGISRGR